MAMNGFDGESHQFVRCDAREFLAQPPGEPVDLAVVDPPTFSNSKRTDYEWDVQRDHADMLGLLARHMAPGGVIYFSTNFRRFRLDEPSIEGTIRELSRQTVPEDFRNQRIHRCWRIVLPGDPEQRA